MGFKGTGLLKRKGFLIGFGMVIMYTALIAGSTLNSKMGGWIGAISNPFLMVLGELMIIFGQKIEM